jgi:hypothetical protein
MIGRSRCTSRSCSPVRAAHGAAVASPALRSSSPSIALSRVRRSGYGSAVFSRRRFLFLLGGATAGIWLASTGLIRLERTFVLKHAGGCSFCGKTARDVLAIAGVTGRSCQICDECVGLCCDILDGDGVRFRRDSTADIEARLPQDREALARFLAEIEEQRRSYDAQSLDLSSSRSVLTEFACSFCDRPRSEVAKLISGPRVFICDGCTGEAAGVLSHVLRA